MMDHVVYRVLASEHHARLVESTNATYSRKTQSNVAESCNLVPRLLPPRPRIEEKAWERGCESCRLRDCVDSHPLSSTLKLLLHDHIFFNKFHMSKFFDNYDNKI